MLLDLRGNSKKKEYIYICSFFLILTFIFYYRIFLGEGYSPGTLFYRNLPWSNQYPDVLVRGALLSDPIDSELAMMHFFKRNLKNGILPLWTDSTGLGMPLDLNIFSHLVHPLKWVHYIFSDSLASTIYVFSKTFFTLLGTYKLLRTLELKSSSSIVGSVIYSFSIPMIVWSNWPHTEVGMLAPWLFVYVIRLYNESNKIWKNMFISSWLMGLMITSGMPAYAAYYLYIISFYYLIRLICDKLWLENLKSFLFMGFRYLGVIILSIVYSAPYILPFIDSLSFTNYLSARSGQNAESVSVLKNYLLNFFTKNYYINSSAHFNEVGIYFGIISLFLLVLAYFIVIKIKAKKFYYFLASNILIGSVVIGIPVLSIIKYFPLIRSSSLSRLIMPFIFLSSILIGKTWDVLLNTKNLFSVFRKELAFAIITFASLLILICFATPDFKWIWELTLSLIILCGYLVLAVIKLPINKRQIQIGLILILILFDSMRGGIGYHPSMPFSHIDYSISTESTDFLINKLDDERFVSLGSWSLFPNTSLYYDINDLASHSLMMPEYRHQQYYSTIDDNSHQTNTRTSFFEFDSLNLLNYASVKYILSEAKLNEKEIIHSDVNSPKKTSGEFIHETILKQYVKAQEDNLNSINILAATYSQKFTEGCISYTLEDADNYFWKGTILATDIKDNNYITIDFPEISNSKNKEFILTLESKNFQPTKAPTFWVVEDDKSNKPQYINDKLTNNSLIMVTTYKVSELENNLTYIDTLNSLHVYQNNNYRERLYFSDDTIVVTDPPRILTLMDQPTDTSISYIEQEPHIPVNNNGESVIHNYEITPNKISLEVTAQENSFLVSSDAYHPNWRVFIDNKEVPLYRANYIFRGVIVPQGDHSVVFKYVPSAFYVGLVIFIIGHAIFILVWIISKSLKEKKNEINHPDTML